MLILLVPGRCFRVNGFAAALGCRGRISRGWSNEFGDGLPLRIRYFYNATRTFTDSYDFSGGKTHSKREEKMGNYTRNERRR